MRPVLSLFRGAASRAEDLEEQLREERRLADRWRLLEDGWRNGMTEAALVNLIEQFVLEGPGGAS